MPAMEEALGDFVEDYFTEVDLFKDYWQIPLWEKIKAFTAFATNRGLMQFSRMGLKTAYSAFVRLMRRVLAGLPHVSCYFDNVVVHNPSWSEPLIYYRRDSQQDQISYFAYSQLWYLGFSFRDNCLGPPHDKVNAIIDIVQNKKQ